MEPLTAYVVAKSKAPALQKDARIGKSKKRLAFSLNVGRAYA